MKPSGKLDSDSKPFAFLLGGGEMGSLIRSMDWSETSLGPVAEWPQSLRTTVSICLASDLPICVIWGPGLVQLYNDAYRVIIGEKHPRSMGQNFSECFRDAWPVIGAAHDSALAGDTAFLETQQIFLEQHGYVEETFFTFLFSPIRDEAGRVRAAVDLTDLADVTADLASNFRSACDKDGPELRVDCLRLSKPVFVDRTMWETLLLNLLSNAFKFTSYAPVIVYH